MKRCDKCGFEYNDVLDFCPICMNGLEDDINAAEDNQLDEDIKSDEKMQSDVDIKSDESESMGDKDENEVNTKSNYKEERRKSPPQPQKLKKRRRLDYDDYDEIPKSESMTVFTIFGCILLVILIVFCMKMVFGRSLSPKTDVPNDKIPVVTPIPTMEPIMEGNAAVESTPIPTPEIPDEITPIPQINTVATPEPTPEPTPIPTPLPTPEPTPVVEQEPGLYAVSINSSDGFVNLRSGPSEEYEIICPVSNGTVFQVYQEQNNWGYVNLNGSMGWISLMHTVRV